MLVDFPRSGFSSVHHCEATMNSLKMSIHETWEVSHHPSYLLTMQVPAKAMLRQACKNRHQGYTEEENPRF